MMAVKLQHVGTN